MKSTFFINIQRTLLFVFLLLFEIIKFFIKKHLEIYLFRVIICFHIFFFISNEKKKYPILLRIKS